jgi:hypothetical protein
LDNRIGVLDNVSLFFLEPATVRMFQLSIEGKTLALSLLFLLLERVDFSPVDNSG